MNDVYFKVITKKKTSECFYVYCVNRYLTGKMCQFIEESYVRVTVGVCLTFLYTVCNAGSRSSAMWKRGGLVEDSFIGLGSAMILPSSPNHFFPLRNKTNMLRKDYLIRL